MEISVPEGLLSSYALDPSDIYLYSGVIDRDGADKLIQLTTAPSNKKACLIICTFGGDPNAAFKIARRLQEKYEKFSLFIDGYCKSAGTLIAVGSDEVIMSGTAELGPLDIQLQKEDEISRQGSSLSINEALRNLKEEAINFFDTMLKNLNNRRISTRTAAELATIFAIGFVEPILSQIDPIKVGESRRAIRIALDYGDRLAKERGNLSCLASLYKLIFSYPDHGHVIDYKEAQGIFKNVIKRGLLEKKISETLGDILKNPCKNNVVEKLELNKEEQDEGAAKKTKNEDLEN